MRNPPPAKTRQTAVAGFLPRRVNDITPNPPPRHGNQRGSVSAKTRTAPEALRGRPARALRREDGAAATWPRSTSSWPGSRQRGLDLHDVRTRGPPWRTRPTSTRRGRRTASPTRRARTTAASSALKSLFRFLYRRGYVLTNPAATLQLPRTREAPPADDPHARRRRAGSSTPRREGRPRELRDRAILETFYATGIRAGELANLTPEDVDTEERIAARRPRQGRQGPQRPAHDAPRPRRSRRTSPRADRSSWARPARACLFLAAAGG